MKAAATIEKSIFLDIEEGEEDFDLLEEGWGVEARVFFLPVIVFVGEGLKESWSRVEV